MFQMVPKLPFKNMGICLRITIWLWLKIKQEGLRGFWSMFPLTRVPFWYRVFEPHPYTGRDRPHWRLLCLAPESCTPHFFR